MLSIRNIKKQYRDFTLYVEHLDIPEGGYFVLMGPTGSGKTLLLNIIAGIVAPDQGSISKGGRELSGLPPEKRNIGVVYQDSALFPHLTVEGNIGFGPRMRGVSKKEAVNQTTAIMERLSITSLAGRRIQGLSGGEKQRVALARALVLKPSLILLDEPMSSLDYQTAGSITALLTEIHTEYRPTIFHITHDFHEALSLAETAGVMNAGIPVQTGSVIDIFTRPNNIFTAGFTGARNIFSGHISGEGNSTTFITEGGTTLFIGRRVPAETRHAMIRPDDIILSHEKIESSATNSFKAQVEEIILKEGVTELVCNAGIQFRVFITGRSLKEMGITIGDRLYLTFKGSAIHLF